MEDKLKEYIWQDFRKSNIPKYYKYFGQLHLPEGRCLCKNL